MKIKGFIKDKCLSIATLLFAIVTSEILLISYPIATFIKIYIPVAILSLYLLALWIEYITKKHYYSDLKNMLDDLQEKYLVTEIIKSANFIEGNILKSIIEEIDKSMVENVNYYKYLRRRL